MELGGITSPDTAAAWATGLAMLACAQNLCKAVEPVASTAYWKLPNG